MPDTTSWRDCDWVWGVGVLQWKGRNWRVICAWQSIQLRFPIHCQSVSLEIFFNSDKKKMTRPICPFNTSIKGKWLAHQYIDICRSCFYKAKIIPASRKTFWQLNNGYIWAYDSQLVITTWKPAYQGFKSYSKEVINLQMHELECNQVTDAVTSLKNYITVSYFKV